jgi:hypothetical protein
MPDALAALTGNAAVPAPAVAAEGSSSSAATHIWLNAAITAKTSAIAISAAATDPAINDRRNAR